jgi:hypothetical protein
MLFAICVALLLITKVYMQNISAVPKEILYLFFQTKIRPTGLVEWLKLLRASA